jgi:hypothetical protein
MATPERRGIDLKVRFWMSDKPRERLLSEAFLEGVKRHGEEVDKRSLGEPMTPDCDVAVMVGVKSRELWREHARAGVQLLYLDKGYDRHSRDDDIRGWEYWRVSVNGHQPTSKFRPDYPDDRRRSFGWKFKPWRKAGKHILIAGSSAKYHDFYDLREPTDWAKKVIKSIRRTTRREIVYRPKPSWKDAVPIEDTRFSGRDEKISDALKDCHCVVTHGSNACFEAMLAGVPSIVLGDAVMKPISSVEEHMVENPRLASDKERDQVLNFLAYQQWTQIEMLDGIAWPHIRRQFFE